MPSINTLDTKINPHRTVALYLLALALIVLTVYYLPNYFFLEKATADHSSLLLNLLGVPAESSVVNQHAFIGGIYVSQDCTGIQVIAVFLGLILPLPMASWKGKLLSLGVISAILYVANLLRITMEYWLVYSGALPWSLAHYPMSLLLGVAGVSVLVLVTDRLMPEFGEFMMQASLWVSGWIKQEHKS